MKYFLPTHCDSGNRGCEAIAKGTALLLNIPKDQYFLLSQCVVNDEQTGVSRIGTLFQVPSENLLERLIIKVRNRFSKSIYKKRCNKYYWQYRSFLKLITKDDVMLSTGGDMFCYEDNEAVYTCQRMQKLNIPTVLWGCSVGLDNLSQEKVRTLRNVKMIYARESLTKDMLEANGFDNVSLFPDPAFILQPEDYNEEFFQISENTIGVNLSCFVIPENSLSSAFGKEVTSLFNYILQSTDLNIVLFPHVLWADQDDRITSKIILEKYGESNRVSIFPSEKFNYCQIRKAISRCKYFIGARTHSVISAYSTGIPTIALGYSVKSKGIAKDLGLPSITVIDSKNIIEGDLIRSFSYLQANENELRNHLRDILPVYIDKLNGIEDHLRKITYER